MKIRIKRFDKKVPLPSYKTDGAACMDLYSRGEIAIPSQEIGYIPLNIAIEIPKGYWAMIVARSSTHKMGLWLANGIGIGDSDFNGDNDEYKLAVFNFTKKAITIENGTRIAQMMIIPYEKIEIEEVKKLDNPDRGGFGSTGSK